MLLVKQNTDLVHFANLKGRMASLHQYQIRTK